MQRIPPSLLLSLAIACGASPSAEDGTTPSADATGGIAAPAPDAEVDEATLMEDPCAEGEGEPCAEDQGVDAVGGEITEAGGADAAAEGADTEEEPQMSWRDMVGAGRVVFDRVCGVCHPEGEEDIGPDIRRRRVPLARLQRIIRRGTGRMRPIPQRKLPDRHMDALMAYLSTMGTVSGVQRPAER